MQFPKNADLTIIGGGIVGVAAAYYLARSGRKNIIVLEKNTICSGSTGRCGAGIRAQWGLELNCRMALASLDIFEHLEDELGMPVGLDQGGYLLVAYKENEWEQFKKNIELQHSLGMETETPDLSEAREICPGLAGEDAIGFTYHARDGHADPFLTTLAYQEAAKELGVKFFKNTEVTGLKVESGIIKAVGTNKGTVWCGQVINCAGPWAQDVAAMAGIKLPNWAERHEILVTEPVAPGVCPPMLMSFSGNYYMQQRPNGTIIAGESPAHEPHLGYGVTAHSLYSLAAAITKMLPCTKELRVVRQWAGYYDMTPDAAPILGETDVRNFYHATGFSGHGFMLAPVAGKIMTSLLNGETPFIDPATMDYHRFEHGELIVEPNVV